MTPLELLQYCNFRTYEIDNKCCGKIYPVYLKGRSKACIEYLTFKTGSYGTHIASYCGVLFHIQIFVLIDN